MGRVYLFVRGVMGLIGLGVCRWWMVLVAG